MSLATKTRVVRIERWGPPHSLVEREVPLAAPGPGEVQIAVEASGVNFADLLMRAGLYATVPPRPFSPGFEVAGRLVAVGANVESLREGDRVLALLRHGGYAHHVVVPAGNCFPCPAELPAERAAAIPVVFLTAWVCLFEAARAREGETALVLGAAGGVGTAAVQLAVQRGLQVVGTAGSARKRAFVVEQLGAAGCYDSLGGWEEEARSAGLAGQVDLALDPVGGEATAACKRLLAPLGRIVFYGLSAALPRDRRGWLQVARAWWRTPRFHPLALVEPNQGVFGVHLLHLGAKEPLLAPALAGMLADVVAGRLRPVLDRTFPLDASGAAAAHAHLHARGNLGKVVLVTPG